MVYKTLFNKKLNEFVEPVLIFGKVIGNSIDLKIIWFILENRSFNGKDVWNEFNVSVVFFEFKI